MFNAVVKALFVLVAAWGASADDSPGFEGGRPSTHFRRLQAFTGVCVVASNDFQADPCGDPPNQQCCMPNQKCIKVVQKAATVYECSQSRKLTCRKAILIVVMPLFVGIMAICFVAFMAVKLNILRSHTTQLCVVVITVSWPLLLSKEWAHGIYSMFLALFVAYFANAPQDDLPFYVFRIAWALQLFQVMALFGPTEAFHVPFWGNSGSGASTDLIESINTAPATCSTYYEDYFTQLASEKLAQKADPTQDYHGLCTPEFLSFVQVACLFQGMIWLMTILVSAPTLLSLSGAGRRGVPQQKPQQKSPEASPVSVGSSSFGVVL